jgi:hypothetical protein
MQADGTAVLAWREFTNAGMDETNVSAGPVLVSVRPARGSFSRARLLTDPAALATDLNVAIGAGRAVVGWTEASPDDQYFYGPHTMNVAVREPGAAFGSPVMLSSTAIGSRDITWPPGVAVDASGTATIAWGDSQLHAAVTQAAINSRFEPPASVAPTGGPVAFAIDHRALLLLFENHQLGLTFQQVP